MNTITISRTQTMPDGAIMHAVAVIDTLTENVQSLSVQCVGYLAPVYANNTCEYCGANLDDPGRSICDSCITHLREDI